MTPDLHELARIMAAAQTTDHTPDEFLDEATAVLESDWLKARDARVAAQALRAAADALREAGEDAPGRLSITGWLRARADAIERGAL